jgi:hypothetical protein
MRMRHIVIGGLPRSTIFFPHYLINGTIFENKLQNKKVCFDFLEKFRLNISHSKKKLASYNKKKYMLVFM